MHEPSTIYVIDNDPNLRSVLEQLAQAFDVTLQFHDTAEAFLQAYSPDAGGCVVSEFRLRGMNGIELQQHLAARGSRLPIIFVTAHAETRLTVKAIKSGAVDVLEKPFSRQDLWDALRQSLDLYQQIRRVDAEHQLVRRRMARITPKEREVLNLMIDGKANKEIAAVLSVSVRTVEARRHQIFKKAGVESVAQLVKVVLESGETVNSSDHA